MDAWEVERPAEAHSSLLGGLAIELPRSVSKIDSKCFQQFFLGSFLAKVHEGGYRYCDFHSGNVGYLPRAGGFCIIDSGGCFPANLNPDEMAGDFLVPLSGLSHRQIVAFLVGYCEAAATSLDSLFPGYTDALLRRLGVTRTAPSKHLDNSTLRYLQRILDATKISLRDIDLTDQVRLTGVITCVIITHSSATDDDKSAYIHRILDAIQDHPSSEPINLEDSIARLNLGPAINDAFSQLFSFANLDLPCNDDGHCGSGTVAFWPRAIFSQQLSGWLQSREAIPCIREAVIDAYNALAQHATASSQKYAVFAFSTLLGLAFHAATEDSVDLSLFEYRHEQLWSVIASDVAPQLPTLGHMSITSAEEATVQASLFLEAAAFELAFWGASVSHSLQTGETICWQAYANTFQCIRRAYLAAFYGTAYLPHDEATPALLHQLTRRLAGLHRHAIRLIAHPQLSPDGPSMSAVWGGGADIANIVNAEVQFADNLYADLGQADVLPKQFIDHLLKGIEFFESVDQTIRLLDRRYIHSRQTCFHGVKVEPL